MFSLPLLWVIGEGRLIEATAPIHIWCYLEPEVPITTCWRTFAIPGSLSIVHNLRMCSIVPWIEYWKRSYSVNIYHIILPLRELWTIYGWRKGQESLTKLAKFGPFPGAILYKSCLFYPSWQAISSERPPSWVAFIEGFHCISYKTVLCTVVYWPVLYQE